MKFYPAIRILNVALLFCIVTFFASTEVFAQKKKTAANTKAKTTAANKSKTTAAKKTLKIPKPRKIQKIQKIR